MVGFTMVFDTRIPATHIGQAAIIRPAEARTLCAQTGCELLSSTATQGNQLDSGALRSHLADAQT
jgi:hypothetical protein